MEKLLVVKNEDVWTIVHLSGLPFSAVRALLIRGWTFHRYLESPPVWVAPVSQLKKEE